MSSISEIEVRLNLIKKRLYLKDNPIEIIVKKSRNPCRSDNLSHCFLASSIGPIELIANSSALIEIRLKTNRDSIKSRKNSKNKILSQARRELRDYLDGKLSIFKVPVLLTGTNFQLAVWERLTQIPYGEKLSYSALAESIGHIGAARAVGLANGRNKLPIIVPCHRVICADGKSGGYLGGAEIKNYLIELENRRL